MLADITISTEAMVVISSLMAALSGAVVVMFRQLSTSQSERLTEMRSERDSYRQMANDAITSLESKLNELRHVDGIGPFPIVAPIVPEHSSPTTAAQQATADMQTMRARLTAATLGLGLPARSAEDETKTPPV